MADPKTDSSAAAAAVNYFDFLFVGTHGWVAAIHKFSGKEVWRTSLPGTGWSIVTLLFEDGVLFTASHGKVFGVDPATGEILWENPLPSLGNEAVCLATVRTAANAGHDPIPQLVSEARRRAAATTSTTSSIGH